MRRFFFAAAVVALAPALAHAEAPVQRTVYRLPSANGRSAILLDLKTAKLTHFREHLFAAEEPTLDASGKEIFDGSQPKTIATRDLLYDAYFGLRHDGTQGWLTKAPVDADASGYAPWAPAKTGGTGIATMVQHVGALEVTTYAFSPRALDHAGFVLAARVRNTGATKASGVALFSIQNFHMGFGRPGVMTDIGENGETISYDAGKGDFLERGFAGVVVARALGGASHHAAWSSGSPPGANAFAIVDAGGAASLPDVVGDQPTADGSVSAFESALGDLDAGAEGWFGVAVAHHGDPFGGTTAEGWLDAYVAGRTAKALVDAETAEWSAFQGKLTLPAGSSDDEETLVRHQGAMLKLAQVEDDAAYLREWLTQDGEPRFTRFGTTLGGPPAKLPATIAHRGKGAVLASLPPGEWTVTWSRDTAYSVAAMSALGMSDEAKAALGFYLGAEGGRFQGWDELKAYAMPPYQISLVRYTGFGVEETDVNDFGPNLEFDGLGLFLWSLGRYEAATKDGSVADASWLTVTTKVADVLVALVDPTTGLLRRDSSIWESHWKGRERAWTYSNVTAARGLCDAAAIADRKGDAAHAKAYRDAGGALRAKIAARLRDPSGALASNAEELASGEGYWDAAVLDAIGMGLFDPSGKVASATLAGLDAHLLAPAGAGWSRNDDRTDHAGKADVSPWGGPYDSAEWVFTDLRGAIATRLAGDTKRSDRLLAWVRAQTLKNYLEVAETYDENSGAYAFNSPMIGFGAGAWVLALAARGAPVDPACGAYFDEGGAGGGGGSGGAAGGGGKAGSGGVGGAAGAGVGGASSTAGAGAGVGGASAVGGKGGTPASAGAGGAPTAGSVVLPGGTPPTATPTATSAPGCSCEVGARERGVSGAFATIAIAIALAWRRVRSRRRLRLRRAHFASARRTIRRNRSIGCAPLMNAPLTRKDGVPSIFASAAAFLSASIAGT